MFEKVSRIAERAATGASRRQFLGRIGTGAMAAAAAFAGLLVDVSPAQAGRRGDRKRKRVKCCYYGETGDLKRCKKRGRCPKVYRLGSIDGFRTLRLHHVTRVSSCKDCFDS